MLKLYIFDEVNQDYKSQVTNINNKVKQYQDAKQAISSINNSNLDSAIRNAQSTNGVKLIDDGTRNVTVDVNNYATKKAEIERDNKQQADSINSQVQQYKHKLDEYQKNLNSEQINPDLIKQQLILGNEADANISYKALRGDIKVEYNDNKGGMAAMDDSKTSLMVTTDNQGNLTGDVLEVTYSNLNKSTYKGKKIAKIIATYSNVIRDKLSEYNVSFRVMSNPFEGFWYWQTSAISVNYKYYDQNNNLINFDNDDQSWITIGSLNSGFGRYESAKLNSNGKTYSFYGGDVTVHNGNTLYSDKSIDINSEIGSNWKNTKKTTSKFPWGTEDWDRGLDDLHAYYGAGVFKITGNNLNITYGTTRINMNMPGTWATISTTIPKSNSGIVPPTLHYHHTNVELQQPEAVHYHLDSSKKYS